MLFAWQGWKIEIQHRWSPLRLEGDYDEGYALIADLQRPRLGLRWKKTRCEPAQAEELSRLALSKEVGVLAAGESSSLPDCRSAGGFAMSWEGGRLYTDPQPPGRDVWVAYSRQSSRTVQVVYHAQRRDRQLATRLLPTLCDQDNRQPAVWAAFELQCTAPAGWTLTRHRLNVGDLSLTFRAQRNEVTVRQVALASLAINRQPLEKWLLDQCKARRKHYRVLGDPAAYRDDRFEGLQVTSSRRRRFFLLRYLASSFVTLATVDTARDRLLIVDGTDLPLAQHMLHSITSPLLTAEEAA